MKVRLPTPARPAGILLRALAYLILACAISWSAFWLLPERVPWWLRWPVVMWGPGAAALVLRFFDKANVPSVPVWGKPFWIGAACYFVPDLVLAVVGLPGGSSAALNPHVVPLIGTATGFTQILGEELGWRGYLDPLLARSLKPWARCLVVAAMWEAWHIPFRINAGLAERLGYCALVIALSVILSWVTRRTNALILAVAIHGWVDLLIEYSDIRVRVVFGFALLIWSVGLYVWPPLYRLECEKKYA